MLVKGQMLHVSGDWLENWQYEPSDFEVGKYWAFVASMATGEIQFFERIPEKVKLADFEDMLREGKAGEYILDVEALFRHEGFTLTDDDEAWIVQIDEIQPHIMARLVTPIYAMPDVIN